jgi:predicted acetyltransferase
MSFILIQASKEDKTAIENLMQFYIYDFTEFIKYDVEDNGLFASYPHLEDYWREKNNKFPYVIKKGDKYVGFVLVKLIESEERSYFSIVEFFIMKKYRRLGIGKAIAFQVFDLHKGQWEVYQKDSNKPARVFWKNVIKEYTRGQFKEHSEDGKQIQNFES